MVLSLLGMGCDHNPVSPSVGTFQLPATTIPPLVTTPTATVIDVRESGPLSTRGLNFYDQSGNRWQWRGVSSFLLFKRYLDGEDITEYIRTYQAVGANTFRIFGRARNISSFNPTNYPSYFSSLSRLSDFLASLGVRMEFTALVDAQDMTDAQQTQFVNQIYNALQGHWNVFVEICNECEPNGVFQSFNSPTNGILASAGSGAGCSPPRSPLNGSSAPFAYATYHDCRSSDWWEHPGILYAGVPTVSDEPMGASETFVNGRRDNNPSHFYRFGQNAKWWGATFHSEPGLRAELPGPITLECAKMMFKGMME